MPIDPDILIAFGSLMVAAIALIASIMRNYSSDERGEQLVSDRLDAIADSVRRLTSIVEGMDAKLDAHAESIARTDEKMKTLDSRLGALERRLETIEREHARSGHAGGSVK